MTRQSFLVSTAIALLLPLGGSAPCRADTETDLLQKFQNQNQNAARKLVQDVEAGLGKATELPLEKAVQLLSTLRGQLAEDQILSRAERDSLRRRVDDVLRVLRERVEEQRRLEAAAQAERDKKAALDRKLAQSADISDPHGSYTNPSDSKKPAVKQTIFTPQFTPVTNSGSFTVTPVASADRMWVRIGISGSFTFARPGPFVPVPFIAPNVLQGPGKNLTVVPPLGIKNFMTQVPIFGSMQLSTSGMAPSGGGVVLGGNANQNGILQLSAWPKVIEREP